MPSDREIRAQLQSELDRTSRAYEEAKQRFTHLIDEVPSRVPHPDSSLRITNAQKAYSAAMTAYMRALREFSEHITIGSAPERRTKKTPHPEADEFEQYCRGAASPEVIRQVEEHLDECPECSQKMVQAVRESEQRNH